MLRLPVSIFVCIILFNLNENLKLNKWVSISLETKDAGLIPGWLKQTKCYAETNAPRAFTD